MVSGIDKVTSACTMQIDKKNNMISLKIKLIILKINKKNLNFEIYKIFKKNID